MNIYTKQKQTGRYRGQTSGNKWEAGSGEGYLRNTGLRNTNQCA